MAVALVGFSFPLRKDSAGIPAQATNSQLIKESIVQILSTEQGERVRRRDFGVRVRRLLFEPNNLVTAELIRLDVNTALTKFETRIIVRRIQTDRDVEQGIVRVTIEYLERATLQAQTVDVDFPVEN